MKKLLCLVLTVVMVFSCFSVCLTASAANYYYRPDIVSKVIDPIIAGANTEFSNTIYDEEFGYKDADSKITKAVLKSRINLYNTSGATFFPADDKMFGVNFDFLYNKSSGSFTWDFCKFELGVNPNAHQIEVDTAEANKSKSTCQMKGWYDACSEVLNGFEYDYETKSYDKQIFENIIEVKEVIYNEYTRKNEAHYRYYFFLEKGEFSLMRSNSNYLLNKILKNSISSSQLLDVSVVNENAVNITNFIGNLLYVDFKNVTVEDDILKGISKLTTETFFRRIAEKSGLASILDSGWCNATAFNVKDIMSALGVVVKDDVILSVELNKGNYMGGRILTDMYASFVDNPMGYIAGLFQLFCRNYSSLYSKPINKLFFMKVPEIVERAKAAGFEADYGELKTVDEFVAFLSDCLYFERIDRAVKVRDDYIEARDAFIEDAKKDGKIDAAEQETINKFNSDIAVAEQNIASEKTYKFTFPQLPAVRLANAADIDELYLYLLCYFEISRAYEGNAAVIGKFINDTESFFNAYYVSETKDTDIANMKTIFGDIFQGKLTMPAIQAFYLTMMSADVVTSFPDNFSSNIKTALANLLHRFITAMDNFFNVLFGWTEGLFDKNK